MGQRESGAGAVRRGEKGEKKGRKRVGFRGFEGVLNLQTVNGLHPDRRRFLKGGGVEPQMLRKPF